MTEPKLTFTFKGHFVGADNAPIAGAEILYNDRVVGLTSENGLLNLQFKAEVSGKSLVQVRSPGGKLYTFDTTKVAREISNAQIHYRNSKKASALVVELGTIKDQNLKAKGAPQKPLEAPKKLSEVQEELEDFILGGVQLSIPPTSIIFLHENQVEYAPVMRSTGIQFKNGGQDRTLVVNFFFQADGTGVMPKEFTRLLAIAETAPFVPVENAYLNLIMDVQAVGIMNYTLESVEGLPMAFNLQMVLKEFNFRSYLPYAVDFSDYFDWDVFNWYIDRYIRLQWGIDVNSSVEARDLVPDPQDRSKLRLSYNTISDTKKAIDDSAIRESRIRKVLKGEDDYTVNCPISFGVAGAEIPRFKEKVLKVINRNAKTPYSSTDSLDFNDPAVAEVINAFLSGGRLRHELERELSGIGGKMVFDSHLRLLNAGKYRRDLRPNHQGKIYFAATGETIVENRSIFTLVGIAKGMGREGVLRLLKEGTVELFLHNFVADGTYRPLEINLKRPAEMSLRTAKDIQEELQELTQHRPGVDKSSELFFEELIITKLAINHQNVMAVQIPNMAQAASMQFLGRMPKRITLELRTENLQEVRDLTYILGTLNNQLQAYHTAAGSRPMGSSGEVDPTYNLPGVALPEVLSVAVNNFFLNSLGLHNVLIQRFTITPSELSDYLITLEATAFDHTQSRTEEAMAPLAQQNSGVVSDPAAHGEANLSLFEQELCRTETYPDLLLPTYDEFNEFLKDIGREPLAANKRAPLAFGIRYTKERFLPYFVDPDFYIRYDSGLSYETGMSLRDPDSTVSSQELAVKRDRTVANFGKELYEQLEAHNIFPEWQVRQIKQSLVNTIRENFQERARLSMAFPTFYLAFRTEGEDFFFWKNFGEFYGFRGLIAAELHQNRDLPADTLKLTLSNIYNNLFRIDGTIDDNLITQFIRKADSALSQSDDSKLVTMVPFLRNMLAKTKQDLEKVSAKAGEVVANKNGAAGTAAENAIRSIYLQAGARLHFRLGYGGTAAQLIPKFNGVIAELMPGPQVVLLCQGDGIELNKPITMGDETTGVGFIWGDSPHVIIYNVLSEVYGNPTNPNVGGWISAVTKVVSDQTRRTKASLGMDVNRGIAHFGSSRKWIEENFGSIQDFDTLAAGAGIGAVGSSAVTLSLLNKLKSTLNITRGTKLIGLGAGAASFLIGGVTGANVANWTVKESLRIRQGVLNWYDHEGFKRRNPDATSFDNIYAVHGTGNFLEVLTQIGSSSTKGEPSQDPNQPNMDTGGYIKIPLKGKTSWEVIKICEMTAPDYIASIFPYGTRSSVFFGLPWWDMTLANPKAETGLTTYANCGYRVFRYGPDGVTVESAAGAASQKQPERNQMEDLDAKGLDFLSSAWTVTNKEGRTMALKQDVIKAIFKYCRDNQEYDLAVYAFALHRMARAGEFGTRQSPFGINSTLAKACGVSDYQPAAGTGFNSYGNALREMKVLSRIVNHLDKKLAYDETELCQAFVLGRLLQKSDRGEEAQQKYFLIWVKYAQAIYDLLGKAMKEEKDGPGAYFKEIGRQYGEILKVTSFADFLNLGIEVISVIAALRSGNVLFKAAGTAIKNKLKGKVVEGAAKQAIIKQGSQIQAKRDALAMAVKQPGKATVMDPSRLASQIGFQMSSKMFTRELVRVGNNSGKWKAILGYSMHAANIALAVPVLVRLGYPLGAPLVEGISAAAAKMMGADENYQGVWYKVKRPFRSLWMFDSYFHILDNQIFASMDQVYTDVTANYDKGATQVHADVNIFAHLRRNKEVQSPVVAAANVDNYIPSRWYAKSVLKDSLARMYQGNVTVIGQPHVKPYDMVLLQDHYKDMNGPVQVRSTTHVFGPNTGLATVIEPDLVVYTAGNNMELIHTWLWGIQTSYMLWMTGIALASGRSWATAKISKAKRLGSQKVFAKLERRISTLGGNVVDDFAALKNNNDVKIAKFIDQTLGIKPNRKLSQFLVKGANNSQAIARMSARGVVRAAKATWGLLSFAPVKFILSVWMWNGIFEGMRQMSEFAETQAVRIVPLTLNGQAMQAGLAGSIGLMINVQGEKERKDELITGYRNLDLVLKASMAMIAEHSPFAPLRQRNLVEELNKEKARAAQEYRRLNPDAPMPVGVTAADAPQLPLSTDEADLVDGMKRQMDRKGLKKHNLIKSGDVANKGNTQLAENQVLQTKPEGPINQGKVARVRLKKSGASQITIPVASARIEGFGAHLDQQGKYKYYVKLFSELGSCQIFISNLDFIDPNIRKAKGVVTLQHGDTVGNASGFVDVSIKSLGMNSGTWIDPTSLMFGD